MTKRSRTFWAVLSVALLAGIGLAYSLMPVAYAVMSLIRSEWGRDDDTYTVEIKESRPPADDDFAGDIDEIENAVDGVTGSGVCKLLFAAAKPMQGVEGGVFRGPDEFEFDRPLGISLGQGRSALHG